MLSLGQKLVAIGTITIIEVTVFLFVPLLGIIGLFAAAPLAFVILSR